MSSIKKNISYQILYQILAILLPLITSPYISRVLGANGVGIYSYTFSIVSYFALFAKLGIHIYGNRAIAMVRDDQQKLNQTFSDLLAVHLLVSAIALLLYAGYIYLGKMEYPEVAAIQALYVIAEMLEINWLYFGLEQFKITVTRNAIVKGATLVSIFCFVKSSDDVWKYCAIMAISATLSELIVWIFLPKYIKIVKPNWKDARKHILPLISFFIPSIAVSLYKIMDKIMLGMMTNTTQVGFYENSENIIAAAMSFITAVGTAMLPRMSNLVSKGEKAQTEKIIARSMQLVMISVLAMAGGIIGVSSVFAPIFWGEEFKVCANYINGLAISLLFTAFANVIRTQYLIPSHKDKVFQLSVITGACVNLVVNFFLIPHLYALGAVIGTVMAEGAVCMVQGIYAAKHLPIVDYLKKSIPYTLFAAIMSGVVALIGYTMNVGIKTLAVQVLTGIVIYIGLSGLYLYMTKDELLTEFKKSIFRK